MSSLIKSVKAAVRRRFPAQYARLHAWAWPVLGELKTIQRAGPRLVADRLLRRRPWEVILPIQRIERVRLADLGARQATADMAAYVSSLGGSSGRTATYLPPAAWNASELGALAGRYPAGAGLRIAKAAGGRDAGTVSFGAAGSKLQDRLWSTHREQILVYNYFYAQGLGPRLFDLLELEDDAGRLWPAYVVEHVDGRTPTVEEWKALVDAIERTLEAGPVRLTSWVWKGVDHLDFRSPDCNGNAIHDEARGRTLYVDMGHFVPDRYDEHVTRLALAARNDTHFGYERKLLGGRHLYQRVPGVALPARRDTRIRAGAINGLLARHGVDARGKNVFDLGCNLGLMSANFLHEGARWVHGWDLPPVVAQTRELLLGLGCTRFSLTGGDLSKPGDLVADLPTHVAETRPADGIVAFLSTRLQVGWPAALDDLPWRWMVYEGNENENVAVTRKHLAGYADPRGIRTHEIVTYADDTGERTLALLERPAVA